MTIVTTMKKIIAYSIFLILLLWICGYGFFLLHISSIKPEHPLKKTDAIIVLTGGTMRIGTGLELYKDGLAPQLFITGVHNLVTDKDIKAMWHNTSEPLPECCITLGHDATTTTGNSQEAYKWIKDNNIKSIRLVTSSYHMPRAMLEFSPVKNEGGIVIIPHPVDEKETFKHLSLAFKEYSKVLFRWGMLALHKKDFPL